MIDANKPSFLAFNTVFDTCIFDYIVSDIAKHVEQELRRMGDEYRRHAEKMAVRTAIEVTLA